MSCVVEGCECSEEIGCCSRLPPHPSKNHSAITIVGLNREQRISWFDMSGDQECDWDNPQSRGFREGGGDEGVWFHPTRVSTRIVREGGILAGGYRSRAIHDLGDGLAD